MPQHYRDDARNHGAGLPGSGGPSGARLCAQGLRQLGDVKQLARSGHMKVAVDAACHISTENPDVPVAASLYRAN